MWATWNCNSIPLRMFCLRALVALSWVCWDVCDWMLEVWTILVLVLARSDVVMLWFVSCCRCRVVWFFFCLSPLGRHWSVATQLFVVRWVTWSLVMRCLRWLVPQQCRQSSTWSTMLLLDSIVFRSYVCVVVKRLLSCVLLETATFKLLLQI